MQGPQDLQTYTPGKVDHDFTGRIAQLKQIIEVSRTESGGTEVEDNRQKIHSVPE